MKIATVVGARPQFIKAAPLSLVLRKKHNEILIHTGQHYDYQMSDVFFSDLKLPDPDYHLGVGSGLHGAQTGAIMTKIENIFQKVRPEIVIVFGDTNSTLAGALAAAKLNVPVAHVEAGLRSFNRSMPEEINRVVTDHVSTWLFAPSSLACVNLKREGVVRNVFNVGDITLDALRLYGKRPGKSSYLLGRFGLRPKKYYVVTVHRAENTENPKILKKIIYALGHLELPVVFPLHPRTRHKLKKFNISIPAHIQVIEPLGYLDMISLQAEALCILTDSGGVQKEAYYLKIPCITLRVETEWVETVQSGWNVLSGSDFQKLRAALKKPKKPASHPDIYGNGHAAEKIVEHLMSLS